MSSTVEFSKIIEELENHTELFNTRIKIFYKLEIPKSKIQELETQYAFSLANQTGITIQFLYWDSNSEPLGT